MKCRVCGAEVTEVVALPDLCPPCTDKATELMNRPHRLGDKVAGVAKALGFQQTPDCGCRRRQTALNNVNLDGPAAEVAKALLMAIVNPPKE